MTTGIAAHLPGIVLTAISATIRNCPAHAARCLDDQTPDMHPSFSKN